MTRQVRWAGYLLLGVGVVLLGAWFVQSLFDDDRPATAPAVERAIARAVAASAPFAGLTEVELALGDDCLRLVVADEVDERVAGLRAGELGDYDGMLFVFPDVTTTRFTMSRVPVGLDIGFYASSGDLVSRGEMVPCPDSELNCPAYAAAAEYRYAVETARGDLPEGRLHGCSGR